MPSLKELRNRIASVKATQKITKAMQMVAAAKLRRAQSAAEAARPYATRMEAVLANLATALKGREGGLAADGRHRQGQTSICSSSAPPSAGFAAPSTPPSSGSPASTLCGYDRRQAGQDPLRRQEGLRPAEAPLRLADHRGDRAPGREAARLRECREDRREGARTVRRRAHSTWRRCSSRASAR